MRFTEFDALMTKNREENKVTEYIEVVEESEDVNVESDVNNEEASDQASEEKQEETEQSESAEWKLDLTKSIERNTGGDWEVKAVHLVALRNENRLTEVGEVSWQAASFITEYEWITVRRGLRGFG